MSDKMNFNNTTKRFYDPQTSKKVLVNGYNSLSNAKLMQTRGEYYILVKYQEEEELPQEYVRINSEILESFGFDEEHFATVNPELNFTTLIDDCIIKKITRLGIENDIESQYQIGSGPEIFTILDLINEQLEACQSKNRLR